MGSQKLWDGGSQNGHFTAVRDCESVLRVRHRAGHGGNTMEKAQFLTERAHSLARETDMEKISAISGY